MSIYHCSIKIISRSGGRSAVACAAYRAGEKLYDKETGTNWTESRTYLPFLTLMNGAKIKGAFANWGNNQPMLWMVVGENALPVTINTIGALGYNHPVFKISVADITGDDGADCIVNGEIPAFESGTASFRYYTSQKEGAGTLRINGLWALRGTTTINAGGIVFGDSGGSFATAAPGTNNNRASYTGYREFVLKNGSTLGKTAGALELDALTVTGGGKLGLGDTATMSFADSSAKSWSGPLLIEGFREHAVRFGTSASGLTSAQVADIRAVTDTGRQRRVTISSQGYLRYPGFLMIVK